MHRTWVRTIASLLCAVSSAAFALAWFAPSGASRGVEAPARARPATPSGLPENPDGVTLEMATADGRRSYRQGEPIELRLTLRFPAAYVAVGEGIYLGDRDTSVRFVVEPAGGVSDPLAGYADSWLFLLNRRAGSLGGLGGELSSPTTRPVVLNEHVRFDRSGTYRVFAIQNILGRPGASAYDREPRIPAVSKPLELEIVADAEWAGEELRRILAQIDGTVPRNPGGPPIPFEAYRRLRHLGIPATVPEMARRVFGDGAEAVELSLGLIGHPDRAAALEALEARFDAPDQPVDRLYIDTISALAILVRHTEVNEPLRRPEPEQGPAWEAARRRGSMKLAEVRKSYLDRLASVVMAKTGTARAISLLTLDRPNNTIPDDEGRPLTPEQFAGILLDLPADRQRELLAYEWDKIDHEAARSALVKLYVAEPGPSVRPDTARDVRSAALARLYHMDPVAGRPLVLAEIARRPIRIDPWTLGMLPDETLPELDEALGAGLGEETTDLEERLHLIERYASPALGPAVRALLGVGKGWACEEQATMLAYLLRVDPEGTEPLIRTALAERRSTRCYANLLRAVAEMHSDLRLEAIARDALRDRSADVRASARAVLAGVPPRQGPPWLVRE